MIYHVSTTAIFIFIFFVLARIHLASVLLVSVVNYRGVPRSSRQGVGDSPV